MDDKKINDGFIQHVFNFDEEHRGEMLNIIQYTFLSIIPLIVIIKLIERIIPDVDSQKGSIEITGEIIAEIVIFFMGFYFTNKTILYITPYSGIEYPTIVLQSLSFMFIILSMNTKISNKVNILFDRISMAWNGGNSSNEKRTKKTNVRVSQPISNSMGSIQPQQSYQPQPQQQQQQSYSDTSLINSLPNITSQYSSKQEEPNFNAMYQSNSTPLIGAMSPPSNDANQIMAANELLGSQGSGLW
jgi:hypothetical protein